MSPVAVYSVEEIAAKMSDNIPSNLFPSLSLFPFRLALTWMLTQYPEGGSST